MHKTLIALMTMCKGLIRAGRCVDKQFVFVAHFVYGGKANIKSTSPCS